MYPPRIRLMDTTLHLDPDIEASIAAVQAELAMRNGLNPWLFPNFLTIAPNLLLDIKADPVLPALRPWSLTQGQPKTLPWTLNAGPDVPRTAELSDLLTAVYQVPPMQMMVTWAREEGLRQLRVLKTNWSEGSLGDKVIMVSMSTLVVGGMLTPILVNKSTRLMAFDFIKGRDIPVPGVDGLSFRILDHGAGVTAPLGLPGLSGEANLNGRDYDFKITLDVMELLRSRGRP